LVVAFIALLVAGAPFAAAGVKAVKRALFAKNAGKVDGLKASRTPKAGQLLALNKTAHFPASVIPPQPKSTVARARTTGSTSISSGSSNVSVPLTGNTWTQGATEADLVFGTVTYTVPGGCGFLEFTGQVQVNGTVVGAFNNIGSGQSTATIGPAAVLEPGASTGRVLTLVVTNNCSSSASVDAAKIDVVSFR